MNTQVKSPIKVKFSVVIVFYVLLVSLLSLITSCSSDDEAKPDTRGQFVGTYAVVDVSSGSGATYDYDVTISTDSDGNLSISNFADMINVPVKATADGNKLTIKSQSFTNPNSQNTLTVYGSGSLSGNVLNFTYTTEGYLDYSGTCVATKKQ
jgi:hypothetical protein